jgi:hypothetical protein
VGSISYRSLRQVGGGRLSALSDHKSSWGCVRRTFRALPNLADWSVPGYAGTSSTAYRVSAQSCSGSDESGEIPLPSGQSSLCGPTETEVIDCHCG